MIILPRKRFAFDLAPRLPDPRKTVFQISINQAPDNTAIYNSDGVLAFSTGAFAPGVTVDNALYKMWAIDGGIKYNGLAINGQYYMRWLSDFVADGPIPVTSTFDHGYELSASHFVIPKKLTAVRPRLPGLWTVWQLVRVRWRRQMAFPSDRAFVAQRSS